MILNSIMKPAYIEASRIVGLVTGRPDVPKNAPADLRDTKSRFDYLPNGKGVSSMLLPDDLASGVDEPMLPVAALAILVISAIVAAGAALIGLFFTTFLHVFVPVFLVSIVVSAILFNKPGILALKIAVLTVPTFGIYFVWKVFSDMSKPKGAMGDQAADRDDVLLLQAKNDEYTVHYLQEFETAKRRRHRQAEKAMADKSKLITLGTATGLANENEDRFAPDAGLQFAVSMNELSTHGVFLGQSGTGKTACGFKPTLRQLCNGTDTGLPIMDGKGTLASEMVGVIEGLELINPEKDMLSPLFGLNPNQATDAICVVGEQKDFFISAPRMLVHSCGVILHALANSGLPDAAEFRWTIKNWKSLVNDNDGMNGEVATLHGSYRQKALNLIGQIKAKDGTPLVDKFGQLYSAFEYFEKTYPGLRKASDTWGGVIMQCNIWFDPFFTDDRIAAWAATDTGIDITKVCEGKRYGIDIPETVYGQATAEALNNLVRKRFYSALKARGNNWRNVPGQTRVVMAMDEAHLLLNALPSPDGLDDNSMFSIMRSLGGTALIGVQSIEELNARMGEDRTIATLGNFRSLICFRATTGTLAYASSRAGHCLRRSYTIHDGETEISSVSMIGKLNEEYTSPRDAGGKLGSGAARLHKDTVIRGGIKALMGKSAAERGSESMLAGKGFARKWSKKMYPIFDPQELEVALAEEFRALIVVPRGGDIRRDIVQMKPE